MPLSLNGTTKITPSELSTGGPSWDASGNLVTGGDITAISAGTYAGQTLRANGSSTFAGAYTNYKNSFDINHSVISSEQYSTGDSWIYLSVSPAGSASVSRAANMFSFGGDGVFYAPFTGATSPAKSYMCRAWVNFNGTGTVSTNQTMRGNGNVTSVFKNSTGNYTVNFASALPDGNYVTLSVASRSANALTLSSVTGTPLTTAVTVTSYIPGGTVSAVDSDFMNVAIVR